MAKPKINESHISELQFDPKNARKRTPLSAGVIRRSLEQFGGCRSIVIDENNTVRAGNGTLEEAGQLGIEKVIVVEASGNEIVAVKRSGLTDEQWKQYAIADNTASDFSTWDADVLAEIAQEVDLEGFFPPDKLEEVLSTLSYSGLGDGGEESSSEGEDDIPDEEDVETRVKTGDIWQLG